jgi:hypothetical protein
MAESKWEPHLVEFLEFLQLIQGLAYRYFNRHFIPKANGNQDVSYNCVYTTKASCEL